MSMTFVKIADRGVVQAEGPAAAMACSLSEDRQSAVFSAREAAIYVEAASMTPIDMVLYCPACGVQHIDAPEPGWSNPPHRSHRCHGCGHIWRPADVPTNGVAAVKTKGKNDSALAGPRVELVQAAQDVLQAVRDGEIQYPGDSLVGSAAVDHLALAAGVAR